MMKTLLAEIAEKKYQQKKQLSKLKNKYIVIIYSGITNGDNIRTIHKKLYNDTINQKKVGLATSNGMLKIAMKSASSLKKKVSSPAFVAGYVQTTYGSQVEGASIAELLAIFVFDLLKKNKVEKKLSQQINKEANKKEGETKEEAIIDTLEQNLDESRAEVEKGEAEDKVDTSKIMIFYLASSHRDSAKDHRAYQGKMYVNEQWETIPMPWALHNAIVYYIKTHNVKTMQWITREPVWFITRPNCRHYFKELSVKEVLSTSRTKLLEKYDMESEIGNREYMQTIRHPTNKEWYDDIRNAQILLEKYKERLALHQEMYNAKPSEILKKAIEKDKMLIAKWEAYIREKSK